MWLLSSLFTYVRWVAASHEGSSGWSTDRLDIVVVQDEPRVGQGIYVWCWYLVAPMKTYVVPTLRET